MYMNTLRLIAYPFNHSHDYVYVLFICLLDNNLSSVVIFANDFNAHFVIS